MVKVVYVEAGGRERELDLKVGWSVMEGGVRNGIEGIVAECGGTCSCATCHVYVDSDAFAVPDEVELAMLESVAAERKTNSRLSCQLQVSEKAHGVRIGVPDRQY
ncbi:MAG TPA: 2Fe-2S iron-sulfur cluster-binding protein [Magnetospirillaceae bacterium]|jgi:2Fe-2S ferredoxin